MKVPTAILFACLSSAWAQAPMAPLTPAPAPATALPDLPDQTVIAIFDDGVQFTIGDFKKIYAILPPQNQQMAMKDRRTFLQQWAFMRKLSQMAEKEKLDQQ